MTDHRRITERKYQEEDQKPKKFGLHLQNIPEKLTQHSQNKTPSNHSNVLNDQRHWQQTWYQNYHISVKFLPQLVDLYFTHVFLDSYSNKFMPETKWTFVPSLKTNAMCLWNVASKKGLYHIRDSVQTFTFKMYGDYGPTEKHVIMCTSQK